MIQIAMTPEQFAKAKIALSTSNQVTSHVEVGEDAGSFGTSQVAMDYNYADGKLTLDVLAKHGMARFASEGQIKDKLLELLAQV